MVPVSQSGVIWAHLIIDILCSVNRTSFEHLLELIQEDTAFRSTGRKPQLPVRYQLAAFLGRFGSETAVRLATTLGISEGLIYNACTQVTRAFRRICCTHLSWPDTVTQLATKSNMQARGFPGAVTVVDGMLVPLKDKPWTDPWLYWCRKKMYAVS